MPVAKTKPSKTKVEAAARKITIKPSPKRESVLGDHPDTLGVIHRAMSSAAQQAVAENDRNGIATPGTKDGKIVWRQPAKKRAARTPIQG